MLETCIDDVTDPRLQGEVAKLPGFYWLRRGDLPKAIRWSDLACEYLPQDRDAAYNTVFARFQCGRWQEAVTRAKAALARCGQNFALCNILSAALGALGQLTEARTFGTLCLELKQQTASSPPYDLSPIPVPPFDPTQPAHSRLAPSSASRCSAPRPNTSTAPS
jgi:tetratricopeptide (TPR) repeat protein